jgi:hypothetical protein
MASSLSGAAMLIARKEIENMLNTSAVARMAVKAKTPSVTQRNRRGSMR